VDNLNHHINTETIAKGEGHVARIGGLLLKDNPYHPVQERVLFNAWCDGWDKALPKPE
jgi:hypothetical protein